MSAGSLELTPTGKKDYLLQAELMDMPRFGPETETWLGKFDFLKKSIQFDS